AAARSAAEIRRRIPEPTLADLWDVWQALGGDGRLELELSELSPGVLRFRVRRCAYAEAYRALNLLELGLEFSCRRDAPLAKALLPGVALRQSPTLMEGHDGCLFEYRWPE
ncbi:MAG: L-2-amino-thiazoline-4-carboxylic acid hydrolase, partial [Candidatus Adiutrix sp.]|nr:L-2-amino-thiazoline-4-carboxylic acid hydrolase [Candidatus Adiutrix sp.]